jgi:hypothetical protein
MTPCLADLVDMVEGQKLGVEVADRHTIKCSITGNIKVSMLDDNGNWLHATLKEVMCVHGLSHCLFSITKFAQHGHHANIQKHGTTLLFGSNHSPVTIPYHSGRLAMVSDLTIAKLSENTDNGIYHSILAYCNKDQTKKRLPLELLHARLGRCKCRTLLAASEHNLWEYTCICMTGEMTGCLTCGIATIRSSNRNKKPNSGAMRPGEYFFLDIQHPPLETGLTPSTSHSFYLLIVDAYSPYVKVYSLPKKSTAAVIAALSEYQADQSPTGTYGYLDTEHIQTDLGSQFTLERTWQTSTSTARSLLIHVRLPDTYWYHALVYSTYIFNVLPVRGLHGYNTEVPSMPHELLFGNKPRIGHLRIYGCPVIICKWTTTDNSNGKQTERGLHGMYL